MLNDWKMSLTNIEINQAKTDDRPFKLFDANGLYLLVTPTAKSWRFDYRIGGKRGTVVYGLTTELTASKARERHREAKHLLASGIRSGDAQAP